MRKIRFVIYLLVQVLMTLAVIIIFKLNKDVKVASAEAGALFLLMPVVLMLIEARVSGFQQKLWFVGVLQFWILFAVPIMGLRLLNWGADFKDLSFLGVAGSSFHYWSNKSYMLMMAVTTLVAWKIYRASSIDKHKSKKPV